MLIIVQTIFYTVSSIAIIVIGVMLGILIYYLIGILRNTRNLSDDITHTYYKTKKSIKNIISSLSFRKKNEKK